MATRLAALTIGLAAIALPGVVGSQDCLEPVGRLLNGYVEAVASEGDLVFMGDGAVLRVIDLSSPASPEEVGRLELDRQLILSLAVDGDRLYAGTTHGLYVVDVSSPADPVELGALVLWSGWGPEFANALGAAGDTVCVVSSSRVLVVDVSDPTTPFVAGTWEPTGVSPYDVGVVDDLAYVTTSTGGLRVVDLTNPVMPTQVGYASAPAGNFDVVEEMVLIESNGLWIFDISSPTAPVLIGQVSFPASSEPTTDVAVEGDLAFVSTLLDGLHVVDLSDPQQPVWTGTAPSVRVNERWEATAAVPGHAVVAAEDHGIRVISAADPANPAHVAVVDSPGLPEAGAVAGGILVTANATRGVRTLDISSPSAPDELAIVELGPEWWVGDVDVAGPLAVAVGSGLAVVDISDPSAPAVISVTPPWSFSGEAVELVDDLAHVASYPSGLIIMDISDPGSPTEVGSVNLPGGRWHYVDVSGSLVALSGEDRVEIIDVGNPASPTALASVDPSYGPRYRGVALSGHWLFVSRGSSIHVYDLGDPSQPVETDVLSAGASVFSLGVRGSVLYAGTDWDSTGLANVKAWNIGRPSSPVPMGEAATAMALVDLAFDSEHVYATRFVSGFEIFTLCQGPIFADGFESGNTSAWSVVAP